MLLKSKTNCRRTGIVEADRLYRIFRMTGSVFERLCLAVPNLPEQWNKLSDSAQDLERACEPDLPQKQAVYLALERIERERTSFVGMLDQVAVRPGTAVNEMKCIEPLSKPNASIALSVHVHNQCPSVAMVESDFHELVGTLLDNAQRHAGGIPVNETTFCFTPIRSAFSRVKLRVSQTARWSESPRLEGGLARIRELLEHYGAVLSLNQSADPGTPYLEIRFFSWPIDDITALDEFEEDFSE